LPDGTAEVIRDGKVVDRLPHTTANQGADRT
jgi:hypothetical protein